MTSATRDLASHQLWERSLERSRRRRVLAEDARKTISRRRHASLAVSAAMATTPVIPSVIASSLNGKAKRDNATRTQRPDSGQRILLQRGAVSPSVATLQRKLNVPDDGFFGPVTEKAVKKFQKKNHLPATGMVDVKTWLKLFPDGMVIYAPNHGVAQLSSQAPQSVLRSSSAQSNGGLATADVASISKASNVVNKSHAVKSAAGKAAKADVLPSTGHKGTGSSVRAPARSSGGGSGSSRSDISGAPVASHGPFGKASEMIAAMIAAANRIDSHHYAYSWGGGHNSSFSGPYDCSGAVSAVLHSAGLLSRPMVSGEFMHWGRPGRGAVTIYANAGHVYMSILGHFFGTSYANPGGGAGWFNGAARPGFVVVHVPFEAMGLTKAQIKRALRAASLSGGAGVGTGRSRRWNDHDADDGYQSVTPGFTGQAPGSRESSPAPRESSPAQQSSPTVQQASVRQDGSVSQASSGGTAAGSQSSGYSSGDAQQTQAASTGTSSGVSSDSASGSGGTSSGSSGSGLSDGSGSSAGSSGASSSSGYSAGSSSGSGSSSSGVTAERSSSGSSGSGTSGSSGSSGSSGYSSGSSSSSGSSGSGSSGSSGVADQAKSAASSAGSSASSAASSAGGTTQGAAESAQSAAPGGGSGSSGSGSSGAGSSGSGSSGSGSGGSGLSGSGSGGGPGQ